jgi:flagellar hook-associated protein 2
MSAIMDAVYNNYLSAYSPKSITKYDTHKKGELRSVYNSIVNINKESPWYLPTTNRDTQQYAVSLKENARKLHNTIAQLGGLDEEGLFDKKSAYSTDEDIVSASYIGSDQSVESVPEFSVEVRSLASSQENLGLFLPQDEAVALDAGTYSFDVSINDMNYEFQFSVSEGESNRELQNRLVRLVNNSDIGIRASIAESDGRSALRMTSDSTGLPNGKSSIFTVSDNHTSKESGTVEYFGLDYTSRQASNADFIINGEERSSSSNHFTIDKMFDLELKGISSEDEPVQIGLKTDVESLTDNVIHLVGGYNDFLKNAAAYIDFQSRSRQLIKEVNGIAGLYNDSFADTGLTLQDDGTIEVDKNALRQTAVNSDDIVSTFNYIKDFSNALLRKSSQVSINPMDYVDRTIVAYKNPGHNFASPYSTSAYSGMMFSGYC